MRIWTGDVWVRSTLRWAVAVGRQEEGVVHLARRMAGREVESGEVVIVGLDVRAFGHREAHIGEDRGDLVHDLADRMDAPTRFRRLTHRQGDVDPLRREAGFEGGLCERLAPRGDGALHPVTQAVDERTALLALLRRHAAKGLQQVGDRALLAERSDAHGVEGGLVGCAPDLSEQIAFEGFEIGHRFKPPVGIWPSDRVRPPRAVLRVSAANASAPADDPLQKTKARHLSARAFRIDE